MATANYGIDDGDGNQITAGLPEHTARATAQRLATQRGETLYLYPIGAGEEGADAEPIEPEPEAASE